MPLPPYTCVDDMIMTLTEALLPTAIVRIGAVPDTTFLQVSLLGRFHVGHSLVFDKLFYYSHKPRTALSAQRVASPRSKCITPFFLIRTCRQRHAKPFASFPYPRYYALLGLQGDTITLAHPDESYMQKYGRFEEAPVPQSGTLLEDAALQNPLPHLYPARLISLRRNA